MARRKTLTDNMVAKLKPVPKRQTLPDPELRGHYLRVTPTGAKSYVAVARDPGGRQIWATIGAADVMTIDQARERARSAIQRIKDGLEPFEAPPSKPDTFGEIAGEYLVRHVKAKGLRSAPEIERVLNKYVMPHWRDREFREIKRSDAARLLDTVEDNHGKHQADHTLAHIRGVMRWFETRDDDYRCPVTGKMRRTDPKDRKRARILSDDEMRTIWAAAVANGKFGAILRLALLTAQRLDKIASMKWDDVSVDGIWTIPTEDDREKGHGGNLHLPEMALAIVREQKRLTGNPYIFPARRREGHYTGFSAGKDRLVAKAGALPRWTIHDQRRTARSLMARAGVLPHVAERVMGHVQQGVEGVYDRHDYEHEKADALAKLAGLIELILNPPADNVTEFHAEA
jgi:integrase